MTRHPAANQRNTFAPAALASEASEIAGYDISPQDAALLLVRSDMNAIYQAAGERVEWGVWDKKDPINGVAAEVIMSRPDYNGGEVYLIWIDGDLSILQPHTPEADAPIWADEVEEVAALHAAQIVNGFVYLELLDRLVAESVPPAPVATLDQIREVLATNGNL